VQLLSQVRASGVEQQAGDVPAVRHLHTDGADVVTDLLQRRQLGLGQHALVQQAAGRADLAHTGRVGRPDGGP